MRSSLVFFLFTALCSGACGADSNRLADDPYVYVFGGDFNGAQSAGKLTHEASSFDGAVGVGMRYRPYLKLEGEIAVYTRTYGTPPIPPPLFGSIDSRMRLDTSGFAGNAKTVYDFAGGSLYAGVGLGLFWSDLVVTGSMLGVPARRVETDVGVGYQLMLGGDLAIGERSWLGVELRRLRLNGDFGDLSGGSAPIGGDSVALTFRRTFHLP